MNALIVGFGVAQSVLAATFVIAAIEKWVHIAQLDATHFVRLGLPRWFTALMPTFCTLELAVSAALFVPALTRWAAAMFGILLAAFSLVLARILVGRKTTSCGCFGDFDHPVTMASIMRNIALMALTVPLILVASPFASPLERFLFIFVSISLVQSWFLLRSRTRTPKVATIESLELPKVHRLILRDLHGTAVSLASLLAAEGDHLLVFVDPDCAACRRVLPILNRVGEGPHAALWVLSHGAEAENRSMAQQYNLPNLLIQSDLSVASALGISSTPSAVLVGADGTRSSASGVDDVLSMMNRAGLLDAPEAVTDRSVTAFFRLSAADREDGGLLSAVYRLGQSESVRVVIFAQRLDSQLDCDIVLDREWSHAQELGLTEATSVVVVGSDGVPLLPPVLGSRNTFAALKALEVVALG